MDYSTILSAAEEQDFLHPKIAPLTAIRQQISSLTDGPGDSSWSRSPYGFILMVVLPYSADLRRFIPAQEESPVKEYGTIAPFGWRNYYREAVKRLQRVGTKIRAEAALDKKNFRIFSNSRLPEKSLAATLGSGFVGKNSLIITESVGSRCVLAGVIVASDHAVPVHLPQSDSLLPPDTPHQGCGSCTACVDNCPVGAITSPVHIDRDRCLQSLSSQPIELPPRVMERWGRMIYGCENCQEVCPYNRRNEDRGGNTEKSGTEGTGRGSVSEIGPLAPRIPLRRLLEVPIEEVKPQFKKTVLDMSWISPIALQRNALIAAANGNDTVLLPIVRTFSAHPHPVLRTTARWAVAKLDNNNAG